MNPINLNKIIDNADDRCCEIYKITNLQNNKLYIGQCVSHILNHKRYRPYGHKKRLNSHISEAFSKKKNQSVFLNNAIRKYGTDSFIVELIEYCDCKDSDVRETYYIEKYNSLYPNGYNLKNGGCVFKHTDLSKKNVSNGVIKYFELKKYDRFKDIKFIDDDIEKYIKPLNRNNCQYGWYVYIDKVKADFGGVHIPLDVSKNNAIEFIRNLKNNLAT